MTETVLHMLGHVGTDVDYRKVGAGIDLSTFRLASTPRKWDKAQRGYVDGPTNWISVQCWRSLAVHVRDSVRRGDPVIVVGRLRTEEWTRNEVRNSRFVLEATAVGHDLSRGTSRFVKAVRQPEPAPDETAGVVAALEDIERDEHGRQDEHGQQPAPPRRTDAAHGPSRPPHVADSAREGAAAAERSDPGRGGTADAPGTARDGAPTGSGAVADAAALPAAATQPDEAEPDEPETRSHRGWRRAS